MRHSVDATQLDILSASEAAFPLPVPIPKAADARHPGAGTPSRLTDTTTCEITEEGDIRTLWVRLRADAPVKFTAEVLDDLRGVQDRIARRVRAGAEGARAIRYQVFASRIPGVFSLGGDLALFRDCIARRDSRTLRAYAREAVDLVHATATAYGSPVTTIALVQGQALGGGFEAALAAQVLVAERSSRMGLPEVMFNMFPGMGAFQLLAQRLAPAKAEQMILSGHTYSAAELHELGIVDVLAEDGEGESAVRRYIRTHDRQHRGHAAFRRARLAASPLERDVLYRMADVWVDTAMDLDRRDLETIDYLLRAQERLAAKATLEAADARQLVEA